MSNEGNLQDAYRYCDLIARQRARNFYPAFRFLPKSRRLALSTLYAFCSLSDDIADDESDLSVEQRKSRLADWESALNRCLEGKVDSPLFLALMDSMEQFELPAEPFFELLDGIKMDLQPRRYCTFEELKVYCRKVASSIGLVSVRIFGCRGNRADEYADSMGIAFQLTNIMRDIAEDLRRDRVYLPLEDLEAFSYSEEDLKNRIYDRRFLDLMKSQYSRALKYYHSADPRLVGDQSKKLLPAEVMKSVYRRTLEEIKRRKFQVYDGRISIPGWRKISGIALTLIRRSMPSRTS